MRDVSEGMGDSVEGYDKGRARDRDIEDRRKRQREGGTEERDREKVG